MPRPWSATVSSRSASVCSSRTSDPAALGRELHRVVEQVPHHLLEARRIPEQRLAMALEGDVDGDVAGARRRLDVLDGGGDLLGRVEPLPLDLQLARRDPRHVEQVGDELGLDAGVALDGVDARDHVGVAARRRAA